MNHIPRSAIVTAITTTLRRGGIREPELLASTCATAVLDAIAVIESVNLPQAPGSPDDLSIEDFERPPARPSLSLPQPELESVPAPRPQLVIAPAEAAKQPAVAIRPNRAGRIQETGEKKNWILVDLQAIVTSQTPNSIEVRSEAGTLPLFRSIAANEGAYGSGGWIKLSYVAASSTAKEGEGISLGPIAISRTLTEFDPNPIDVKAILTDLTRKAEGIVRTRTGVPVISRNPPTDDAAKSHFRSVTSDMALPAEQKKNKSNWEDADF